MSKEKQLQLYQYLWKGIGGLLILLAWLEGFYINSTRFIGVLILVLLLCNALFGIILKKNKKALGTITLSFSGIAILFEMIWFFSDWYPGFVIAQAFTIIIGFSCFYMSRSISEKHNHSAGKTKEWRPIIHLLELAGVVILSLVSIAVIINSITPVPLMSFIQWQIGDGNTYNAPEMEQTVLDNGYLRINDIEYGSDYPNSYLDAYVVDDENNIDRPTYFYVHGGGWTKGDKEMEDIAYYESMLDAGYNVVSINYALSPEYKYPAPLVQLSQAVAFMQEHGEDYGIDMSKVIFAGSSAGGQIVGQFLNVQTNPAYADEMRMEPVIRRDNITAGVLDSAALDIERMGKTKAPAAFSNWTFFQFSRTYFQLKHFINGTDQYAKQGNVIDHVTENFPPVFIADGNTGSYPDQAKDLSDKLNDFGITNYLYLVDRDKATLGHVFMDTKSKYTLDYADEKVAFLNKILEK